MMESWPRHIDRFERQYDKAFYRDLLFGADLMDWIHKRVQVFLHSCNTTEIEDVESGDLEEFRGLQKRVERGEWLTSMPVWVERPAPQEEGRRKSEGTGNGARNNGVDPQLCISKTRESSQSLHARRTFTSPWRPMVGRSASVTSPKGGATGPACALTRLYKYKQGKS